MKRKCICKSAKSKHAQHSIYYKNYTKKKHEDNLHVNLMILLVGLEDGSCYLLFSFTTIFNFNGFIQMKKKTNKNTPNFTIHITHTCSQIEIVFFSLFCCCYIVDFIKQCVNVQVICFVCFKKKTDVRDVVYRTAST